ncbi:hypothetical protein SRB5_00240 [Streptomyces sp. RB5]|uniref:Oxidoreductase n=2 Tax=Streptomyces smaragdinus TaxID=2585196 RepID=A0A7K0C8Y7_9ACTN|nr:hypothetical protein [Streptomyces smaragdinus]
MSRTPQEVFADHGNRLGTGDLDLISRNYTEDAVLLTPGGTLTGREGVRQGIGALLADLPDADWQLTPRFAGDVLFLQWSATTAGHEVTDGVDTFVFRDGLISAQTVRYTLTPRTTRTARKATPTMAPHNSIPTVTLNNGTEIPQLGFGVFQVPDTETTAAVTAALEAGYRSIDTAAIYGNEAGVGKALAASGLDRGELFVTTKLWNADQGYDSTLRAFDASLAKLGLDHVDMYLIHWPTPARDLYRDTWKAIEKLVADGRVRTAGVSNFQPDHLRRLTDGANLVPAVNQIELHPGLQQTELRAVHAELGIATEAWSPLAQGAVLGDEAITTIATTHGKSPAQVVLRWHLQLGNIVIPKSVTPVRIRENLDVFDFTLTDAEMASIAGLDRDLRTGPHPDQLS